MICVLENPCMLAMPPFASNKLVVNKSVVVTPVIELGTDSYL